MMQIKSSDLKPRLLRHIMFGWVIVSRQLHFHIYNLFVGLQWKNIMIKYTNVYIF
jgi:hypothetical protein